MRSIALYDCMKQSYMGDDRLGGALTNSCRPELPAGPNPQHHSPRCIWHFTKDKPNPDRCRCNPCVNEYGLRGAAP